MIAFDEKQMLLSIIYVSLCCLLISGRQDCPKQSICAADDASVLSINMTRTDGYFIIGGLFNIHERGFNAYECGRIRPNAIMDLEMFFWAIQTYKIRKKISSKIKVGAIAFDSCSRVEQLIEKVMTFEKCSSAYYQTNRMQERIDPRFVLSYIGPENNREALASSEILKDMQKVSVSHAASIADLSNKSIYKYFLRTVPSSIQDINAILSIVKALELKFVIALYDDNMYSKSLWLHFNRVAKEKSICVALSKALPFNKSNTLLYKTILQNVIEFKSVHALVVLTNEVSATKLLANLKSMKQTNVFAIFGLSSWGNKKWIINNAEDVVEGAITLSLASSNLVDSGDISKFKKHFKQLSLKNNKRNIWFSEYWESIFQCDLARFKFNRQCNTSQNLAIINSPRDIEFGKSIENILTAVDSALNGIFEAVKDKCNYDSVCPNFLNPPNLVDQIYKPVLNTHVKGNRVFEEGTGDVDNWKYDIFNIKGGNYFKVGEFSQGKGLDLQLKNLVNAKGLLYENWNTLSLCPTNKMCCDQIYTTPSTPLPPHNTTSPARNPNPVYFSDREITGIIMNHHRKPDDYKTRFSLHQNWVIPLGVLAGLGILIVFILELYFLCNMIPVEHTLLIGIFLCYLTSFAFIPEPTDATCTITRLGVGLSYAICFSILLVRLMILNSSPQHIGAIFNCDNYGYRSYYILMFLFALGVQVVIDVQWLITVPPQAVTVTTLNKQTAWVCNHYTWLPVNGFTDMSLFVRSEFQNHVLSLIYIMFLILLTSIMAILSHHNYDTENNNDNEIVLIGISSGFTIPVWVAWTLIAGLNQNHHFAHQYGDACIAFGLIVTATILLLTVFIPKVISGRKGKHLEHHYITDDVDTMYGNGSVYGGMPPSLRSKSGHGSIGYLNDIGIYSEPVIHTLDPRANHLRYPKANSAYSVHSLPTYHHRPESVHNTSAGTLRVLTMTPDLTGRGRKALSEFGTLRSSGSTTLKRAKSARDIGSL